MINEDKMTITEKIANRGIQSLSCEELLIEMIQRANPRTSLRVATKMAQKMDSSPLLEQLVKNKNFKKKKEDMGISSSEDVFNRLRFRGEDISTKEFFYVITLNGAHKVIKVHLISQGTVNQTIVHPRDVFSAAIADNATAIIIAHNHPSGVHTPSKLDKQLTKRISSGAKIMGISLLDHIIFSEDEDSFFSFADQGEDL